MKGDELVVSPSQRRVLDVIVITDNREHPSNERPSLPTLLDKAQPDFRSSAYKGTPLHTQKLKSTPSSFKETSSTTHTTMTYSQNSTNASPISKIECKSSKRGKDCHRSPLGLSTKAEGAKCVAKTRSLNETEQYF